jgi:cation diffusion facilitator CzcD-associated flavoprotein CzcO
MADFIVPNASAPISNVKRRLAGPIHAERHVKVICIGAGASGLLMSYKLQKHFSNYSLTVYEKNSEVSGTWYENKYPGYVVPTILEDHQAD